MANRFFFIDSRLAFVDYPAIFRILRHHLLIIFWFWTNVLSRGMFVSSLKEMIRRTAKKPEWIHFGAGDIFRAFQAKACQKLLNKGAVDTGIIVAEGFD